MSMVPTLTLPSYSSASWPTSGAIALQGPHQVAAKSTSTGTSDLSTSVSKLSSLNSCTFLPAMLLLLVGQRRDGLPPCQCGRPPGDRPGSTPGWVVSSRAPRAPLRLDLKCTV